MTLPTTPTTTIPPPSSRLPPRAAAAAAASKDHHGSSSSSSSCIDDIRDILETRIQDVMHLMMDDITTIIDNNNTIPVECIDKCTSTTTTTCDDDDDGVFSVPTTNTTTQVYNTTVESLMKAVSSSYSNDDDDNSSSSKEGGIPTTTTTRVDNILRQWLAHTLPLKDLVINALLSTASSSTYHHYTVHGVEALLNWMTRHDIQDVLLQLVTDKERRRRPNVDIIEFILQRLINNNNNTTISSQEDDRNMVEVLRKCIQCCTTTTEDGVIEILRSQLIVAESLVGNTCYRAGDYKGAVDSYTAAIDVITTQLSNTQYNNNTPPLHNDNLVKLRYNLARALYRLGEWSKAITQCDACLALDASYANARVQRAQCYTALLSFQHAVQDYQVLGWTAKADEVGRLDKCDHYTILRLPHYASDNDIKASFRDLARLWHPDKNGHRTIDEIKRCHAWFHRIQESYRVLTDPIERMEYDLLLKRRTIPTGGNNNNNIAANITPTPPPTPSHYFTTINQGNDDDDDDDTERRRSRRSRVIIHNKRSTTTGPWRSQEYDRNHHDGVFEGFTSIGRRQKGDGIDDDGEGGGEGGGGGGEDLHFSHNNNMSTETHNDNRMRVEEEGEDEEPPQRRKDDGVRRRRQSGFTAACLKSRMSEVFSSSRPREWPSRSRHHHNSSTRMGNQQHSQSTSALPSDDNDEDMCGSQEYHHHHHHEDHHDATDGFCKNSENIFRQWWDSSSSPFTKARRRRTTFFKQPNCGGIGPNSTIDSSRRQTTSFHNPVSSTTEES